MNIRELKRRLLAYSGYMKPTEDGAGEGGGTTEEVLDLGNDMPEEGDAATAAPSPAPAPAEAPAADAAGGGDDADEAGKPGGGIPRARFNEVNDRKKALEAEVEALRAQLAAANGGGARAAAAPAATTAPAPAPVDVDALEEEYTQALLEGDTKGAVAIRKQINQHIKDAALQEMAQAAQQQQIAAKSQDVIANTLAEHPWLDEPEGAEALELIEASVRAKCAAGVPHHVALANAIATIAPRFAPQGTPARGLPSGAAPVDTRLKAADERGAEHSRLQPAAVQAGMGNRAVAPKIDGTTKLTEEQIEKLSKEDLDKALGNA